MQSLFAFVERLSSQFWFYNYVLGIFYLFINDFNFFTFLVFPLAIVVLDFINTFYVRNRLVKPYIGFLYLQPGFINLLITVAINLVIYQLTWPILIIGLVFIYLKEERILP